MSIFKGIRKLPPATLLAVEGGQVRRVALLAPAAGHRLAAPPRRNGSSACARSSSARCACRWSATCRSARSCRAASTPARWSASWRGTPSQPIRTYAIGFDGGAAEALYNELPYARQVAQRFGTEHHEIVVKPDVVGLLPRLLWHMDEPIADSAFITTYLVSEFARRDVKVILSGVGGDELFGGYRRYLGEPLCAALTDRLPGWVRRGAATWRGDACRPTGIRALLNALRLAKGFLASAPTCGADERYRSYLQVIGRETVGDAAARAAPCADDPLARGRSQAPAATTSSTACSPSMPRRSCPTTCCC